MEDREAMLCCLCLLNAMVSAELSLRSSPFCCPTLADERMLDTGSDALPAHGCSCSELVMPQGKACNRPVRDAMCQSDWSVVDCLHRALYV